MCVSASVLLFGCAALNTLSPEEEAQRAAMNACVMAGQSTLAMYSGNCHKQYPLNSDEDCDRYAAVMTLLLPMCADGRKGEK